MQECGFCGSITLSRAEYEAMLRDAERYRYLRNIPEDMLGDNYKPCIALPIACDEGDYLSEEDADKAIDAAMVKP